MKTKTLEIWTDGASTATHPKKPGGWAYAYVVDGALIAFGYGAETNTTNQRMEMLAVINGLKNIASHKELKNIEFNHIRIITDSAYIFNAMTQKWYINWKFSNWTTIDGQKVKNRDLWQQLIDLESYYTKNKIIVTWRKVKGHKGVLYNEVVDKLATKAKKSIM